MGIALILLATHKCVENWPASHAIITLCHKWLCRLHRWRELSALLTEGAFLLYSFCLVSFFGGVNSFHRKRSPSLSDGGLVPLIFLYQINFLLIGKTSFEPRDYRVVFIIQKNPTPCGVGFDFEITYLLQRK